LKGFLGKRAGSTAELPLWHKLIPGLAAILLSPWLLAQPAAIHYVIDTEAGYVPPDTVIALAQYLDVPTAVAYDTRNMLYFATQNRIWLSRALTADFKPWLACCTLEATTVRLY
jgi:hypothetical protein